MELLTSTQKRKRRPAASGPGSALMQSAGVPDPATQRWAAGTGPTPGLGYVGSNPAAFGGGRTPQQQASISGQAPTHPAMTDAQLLRPEGTAGQAYDRRLLGEAPGGKAVQGANAGVALLRSAAESVGRTYPREEPGPGTSWNPDLMKQIVGASNARRGIEPGQAGTIVKDALSLNPPGTPGGGTYIGPENVGYKNAQQQGMVALRKAGVDADLADARKNEKEAREKAKKAVDNKQPEQANAYTRQADAYRDRRHALNAEQAQLSALMDDPHQRYLLDEMPAAGALMDPGGDPASPGRALVGGLRERAGFGPPGETPDQRQAREARAASGAGTALLRRPAAGGAGAAGTTMPYTPEETAARAAQSPILRRIEDNIVAMDKEQFAEWYRTQTEADKRQADISIAGMLADAGFADLARSVMLEGLGLEEVTEAGAAFTTGGLGAIWDFLKYIVRGRPEQKRVQPKGTLTPGQERRKRDLEQKESATPNTDKLLPPSAPGRSRSGMFPGRGG